MVALAERAGAGGRAGARGGGRESRLSGRVATIDYAGVSRASCHTDIGQNLTTPVETERFSLDYLEDFQRDLGAPNHLLSSCWWFDSSSDLSARHPHPISSPIHDAAMYEVNLKGERDFGSGPLADCYTASRETWQKQAIQ